MSDELYNLRSRGDKHEIEVGPGTGVPSDVADDEDEAEDDVDSASQYSDEEDRIGNLSTHVPSPQPNPTPMFACEYPGCTGVSLNVSLYAPC